MFFSNNYRVGYFDGARGLENQCDSSGSNDQVETEDVQDKVKDGN